MCGFPALLTSHIQTLELMDGIPPTGLALLVVERELTTERLAIR
jgi:hypothetical protein